MDSPTPLPDYGEAARLLRAYAETLKNLLPPTDGWRPDLPGIVTTANTAITVLGNAADSYEQMHPDKNQEPFGARILLENLLGLTAKIVKNHAPAMEDIRRAQKQALAHSTDPAMQATLEDYRQSLERCLALYETLEALPTQLTAWFHQAGIKLTPPEPPAPPKMRGSA